MSCSKRTSAYSWSEGSRSKFRLTTLICIDDHNGEGLQAPRNKVVRYSVRNVTGNSVLSEFYLTRESDCTK